MISVGIVDYGMGNLRSVLNAFLVIGANDARVIESPDQLSDVRRIVLPGVGGFRDGMRRLREGGWADGLEREVRERGKPFLGLCLGMQLLATRGEEHGLEAGLGWIAGTVTRLARAPGLRIPHVGWNDVEIVGDPPLYAGLPETTAFYFVHSYALRPSPSSVTTGICTYSERFTASVADANIHGTQFHPEKSHRPGLRLLENFAALPCE